MRQDEILRKMKKLFGSLMIQPFSDVAEDFFLFLIVHQKVIGAFVVVVGAVGGLREAGEEASDIGIGIEVVLFSMQHQDGNLDSRRAGIHSIDEFGEGSEQAERVFLDVV